MFRETTICNVNETGRWFITMAAFLQCKWMELRGMYMYHLHNVKALWFRNSVITKPWRCEDWDVLLGNIAQNSNSLQNIHSCEEISCKKKGHCQLTPPKVLLSLLRIIVMLLLRCCVDWFKQLCVFFHELSTNKMSFLGNYIMS